MKSLCLTAARFVVCAWVGAAVLFVVAAVREVRSTEIDSATKDLLIPLRFSAYYACGFTLISVGIVCGWGARNHPAVAPGRMRLSVALLTVALAVMIADYFFIYTPLVAMITPPGQARSATFLTYHQWSERINALDLSLCILAALMMLWPGRLQEVGLRASGNPKGSASSD
jgi:hypothetical protein